MKHIWVNIKPLKAEAAETWIYRNETEGTTHYVEQSAIEGMLKELAEKYEARIKSLAIQADIMIGELKRELEALKEGKNL